MHKLLVGGKFGLFHLILIIWEVFKATYYKLDKKSVKHLNTLINRYNMTKYKTTNELDRLKPKIVKILKKHGIMKAGIFGSYARGENKKGSDIDILIEVPKKIDLYDFVGIKLELEDALGKKVDLVNYKLIRPELEESILEGEVRII